jgi:hypothetical protein
MRKSYWMLLVPWVWVVGCGDDSPSSDSHADAGWQQSNTVDGVKSDAGLTDESDGTNDDDELSVDLDVTSGADELTVSREVSTRPPGGASGTAPSTNETSLPPGGTVAPDTSGQDTGSRDTSGDTGTDGDEGLTCGAVIGDPHILTFDGLRYDWYAIGEFTLTQSQDFEVQFRTYRWFGQGDGAVVLALAARLGEDRVGVYVDGRFLVNGESVEVPEDGYTLPSGGTITTTAHGYLLTSADGAELRVLSQPDYLGAVVCLPSSYRGTVSGPLGNFDGNPSNELWSLESDGPLTSPASFGQFYDGFVDTWRLTEEAETLFDYRIEENPWSYTDVEYPYEFPSLAGTHEETRGVAEQACEDVVEFWRSSCVLDVIRTLDNSFAEVYSWDIPVGTESFDVLFWSTHLIGCDAVHGERPAATPSLEAPLLAGLEVGAPAPGQALLGSVSFKDAQNDATSIILQLGSSLVHHVCPLTEDEFASGTVDFSRFTVSPFYPEAGDTLYVGMRDSDGNVGGYLTAPFNTQPDSAQHVCALPRLMIGAVASQSTSFFEQANGLSTVYRGSSVPTVVASSELYLDLGECSGLYLAGDASGSANVGWDNCLVVEYRPTPEVAPEAVWYYCNQSLFYTATNEPVPQAEEQPTVLGSQLVPPIETGLAFGWEPKTLDLMRYIPSNHPSSFVLTLQVLDFGTWGSTTDVWLLPEVGQVDQH